MKETKTRSECIGKDRNYNEYYAFSWDRRVLYVKYYKPIEGKSKDSENGFWYIFTKDDIEALKGELCEKGIRETKLILSLDRYLEEIISIGEGESTSSDTEVTELDKQGNLEDCSITLEDLKSSMKEAYNNTLNTLGIGNSEVLENIMTATDISQLKPEFIKFSNYTGAILQENTEEELIKKSKVEIFIWEDYGDLLQFWLQFLNGIENYQELFICFHIFNAVLIKYLDSHQPEIPQEETSYSIARRSYRLERLRKIRKVEEEYNDYDQNCYICGEEGFLILCDGCSKVAHQECAGLDTVPDGEWYCSECILKADSMRMTRHRSRLTKCRN